jgi:aspartate/methionine/tyrosine aminotransferase
MREAAMTYPSWLARLFVRSGAARLLPGLQRRLDGGAEYLRYYSDRLLGSPLAQLERVAAALEEAAPDVIDLTAGSPRFDLLPSSTTRLPIDKRGWPCPAGMPELRGAVAARLLEESRLSVSPAEEVLITAGALGAAQVVLDAFVNRGDAVVLTDPVSPMYPLLARTRGARVRWVGAACEDGRLTLRFDQLARRLRGARLLVVNSPHNPTGGVVSPDDLEQLAWWCHRHDALILSDESFGRYHDGACVSVATLPRARERTLTVGSVSKSHALAWARVGWVAAYRHLLRPCLATAALRSPFVPTLSQQIALQALRTPESAFAPIKDEFASRRQYACDRLRAMGLKPDWPGGGFFLWLSVPTGSKCGRTFCESLLSQRRVKLTPGELFGPSGGTRVRVSLAADDGRLDEGLNRIGDHVRRGDRVSQRAKAA